MAALVSNIVAANELAQLTRQSVALASAYNDVYNRPSTVPIHESTDLDRVEAHENAVTEAEHHMTHLNSQSHVPIEMKRAARREVESAQRQTAGYVAMGRQTLATLMKDNPDRPGWNIRGFNYLGPGNPMDGKSPTDPLDAKAMAHDYAYGTAETPEDVTEAEPEN